MIIKTVKGNTEFAERLSIPIIIREYNSFHECFLSFFYRETLEHDLAILVLCRPLRFSGKVSSVCLPSKTTGSTYEKVTAIVTGWGTIEAGGEQSKVLKEADLETVSAEECREAFGKDSNGNEQITDSMLCAKADGRDACQGDSGGNGWKC